MRNAGNGTALPQKLQCTYDQYELDKYDHTGYNSILYLAMLKACSRLATAVSDQLLLRQCEAAFDKASEMLEHMWRQDDGFFSAVWDARIGQPPWIMADTLFGYVVAQHLGLGALFHNATSRVVSHLAAERRYLLSAFGLRTLADVSNSSHCPLSYFVGSDESTELALAPHPYVTRCGGNSRQTGPMQYCGQIGQLLAPLPCSTKAQCLACICRICGALCATSGTYMHMWVLLADLAGCL